MKFLKANAPQEPLSRVSDSLRRDFGLTGALSPLYSERDQNFRLTDDQGALWVVKVVNDAEPDAILDFQAQALAHLAATAPDLPVPRLRRSLHGDDLARMEGGTGRRLVVLSYLAGSIASDVSLDAADFARIGAAIARLQRGLRGFAHPAAVGRGLLWDVREVGTFADRCDVLGDMAGAARALIDRFKAETLPKLAGLRAQVIHGDVHGHNLILGADKEIAGIIDFGDMIHGPALFDLSNALSDFITDTPDMPGMWAALVKGYNAVQPLEPAEVDLLFDLAVMRQLSTLLITAIRAADTPDAPDYIASSGFGRPDALRQMLGLGRDAATALIAGAAGQAVPVARQPVETLLDRRAKVMGARPYLFYDRPLHMVRGEGVWLQDATGRRYLDCYNNVPILGHCHPRVAGAIAAQVRILNTNTRYLGEAVLDYAERLGALTGGELTACAFVNSGSEANDIAWRMARAWTGAKGFLCQEFAYHGITEAIDAVSPSALRNAKTPDHVRTLLAPDPYRGRYRVGTSEMGRLYAEDADRAIASLAEAGMKPAAVIVDSAFMTNGILEPCPGYVAELFARVRAAGGLCIADEVQSGFGRMGGQFWGYQHHGVTPDFVTIGKPAGNGHPIGVVLTRPEIFNHFLEETAFFSTFGGNNVSCAAGLAVLDEISENGLVAKAGEVGALFKAGLQRMMAQHPIIGDVRGTGLAFGVELVCDRNSREPAPAEAARLINLMKDEGLLVGSEGMHGNIVKMRPPLVFTSADVDFALAAMGRALDRL